ncbi:MAG: hypothetical protein ACJ8ET_08085 [Sphingomicrobium sp.]
MDRETRWVAVMLAGLTGLGLMGSISEGGIIDAIPLSPTPTRVGSPDVEHARQCQRRREAELAANARATAAGQRQVIADLRRGGDPARDAREAADDGEWGLIRTYTMMGSTPFGVDCLAADGMGHGAPLVRAYRVYSDVAGSCETFGSGGDCGIERRMDAYAEIYNRALVANPGYPYRDLCRPAAARARSGPYGYGPLDASEWGYRTLEPGPARTIHEAARRGDLAAIERFARYDSDSAGQRDPYGMTPLAWSVAYRQPRAAQLLVQEGAFAAGTDCTRPDDPASPLRLALRTGQDGLAQWLSGRLPDGGKTEGKWPSALMEAAAQGNSLHFLARMLAEPHDRVPDFEKMRGPYSPQALAMIRRYRDRLCWSAPLPSNAQVQLIAIYEGAADKRTAWPYEELPVTVVVRATRKPVVLALSAYDDTEWQLQLEPGARLAGVLALGYETPVVRGVPKGVPVLVNDIDNGCATRPNHALGAYRGGERSELEELQTYVEKTLGRPIAAMKSDYAAPLSYVVG